MLPGWQPQMKGTHMVCYLQGIEQSNRVTSHMSERWHYKRDEDTVSELIR